MMVSRKQKLVAVCLWLLLTAFFVGVLLFFWPGVETAEEQIVLGRAPRLVTLPEGAEWARQPTTRGFSQLENYLGLVVVGTSQREGYPNSFVTLQYAESEGVLYYQERGADLWARSPRKALYYYIEALDPVEEIAGETVVMVTLRRMSNWWLYPVVGIFLWLLVSAICYKLYTEPVY